MSFINLHDFNVLPDIQRLLENDDLSADGIILHPQTLAKSYSMPLHHRSAWLHANIIEAKRPILVGHIDPAYIANSPWIYNVGTFVIKEARSDLVCLPKEMLHFTDFTQQIINYEFAIDPRDAFERTALLLVQSSAPGIGNPFRSHAKDLHIHAPSKFSRLCLPNTRYYNTASRSPTLFYTGAFDDNDINRRNYYIENPAKYIPDFQADAGDINGFTSVHPHKTPIEDSETDLPRVFAIAVFAAEGADSEKYRCNPMLTRLHSTPQESKAGLLERWKTTALALDAREADRVVREAAIRRDIRPLKYSPLISL